MSNDEISVYQGRPHVPGFLRGGEMMAALQTGRVFGAGELAERLGVDKRTVRRYASELRKLGFEVEASRGPDGSYELKRGMKKMPPIHFDSDELELVIAALSYFHTDDREVLERIGKLRKRIQQFAPWDVATHLDAVGSEWSLTGLAMWFKAKAADKAS